MVKQRIAGARQELVQAGELPVDQPAEPSGVRAGQPVRAEPEPQRLHRLRSQEGVDLAQVLLGPDEVEDAYAERGLGRPVGVRPSLREDVRVAAVRAHAFCGIRATRRSEAVSSSICSQGRR